MDNVLDGLVDRKIESIIEVFIKNKNGLFHLKKIAEESNVSIATSFRLMKKLTDSGFVTVIKINKFKVYKLAENRKTRLLTELLGK